VITEDLFVDESEMPGKGKQGGKVMRGGKLMSKRAARSFARKHSGGVANLTNPAIKRLANSVGVLSLNSRVYPLVKDTIVRAVEQIVKLSYAYTEQGKRKTISGDDVREAIRYSGGRIY
jgi:histone H3/H4